MWLKKVRVRAGVPQGIEKCTLPRDEEYLAAIERFAMFIYRIDPCPILQFEFTLKKEIGYNPT